jgi:hypothetical protein
MRGAVRGMLEMRLLFLMLVLANAGFYAYAFVARQQDDEAQRIARLQLSPERIRLVQPGSGAAPESLQKPAPPAQQQSAPALPAACIEWGLFAGPEVARADAAIARLDLPQTLVQRTVVDARGFWVYLPPLKSKGEVAKKIEELKALGVADFFVVQDPAQWRNAISLGIFKTEEGAKKFLEGLREKGVRTAVAGRRENLLRQIAYFVRDPGEATVASLAALQSEFPGSEIRAVPCPATEATKG